MDQFDVYKKKRAKISELIHPIYNGDFDKALRLIKRYRNLYMHNNIALLIGVDRNELDLKFLENAARFIEYHKYSQKLLPPENSKYSEAVKDWWIFENTQSAKQHFVFSIEKESKTRTDAICDYVDFLIETENKETAVSTIEEYKKVYGLNKSFLEKAVSLYSQIGDSEKLYENLQALNKISPDAGNILLRLAECEYQFGKFEKSIETAEKALECGCWINGYAKQMVDSYIALSQYDKAKIRLEETLSKFSPNTFLYLKVKIDLVETGRYYEWRSFYDLDGDRFIDNVLNYSPANQYNLKFVVKDIEPVMTALSNGRFDDKSANEKFCKNCFSAAYIAKHLYGKTKEYYNYLSLGLLYYGKYLESSEELVDVGKCCYLTVMKIIPMTFDNKGKEPLSLFYLANALFNAEGLDKNDELKMAKYMSYRWLDNKRLKIVLLALEFNPFGVDKKMFLEYLSEADKKFDDAEHNFKYWLDATRKNVDFKEDLKDAANAVKNSVLTFESDRKFIEEYLNIISEMQKFYKYDKFGPRFSILSNVLAYLDMFEFRVKKGNSATIFFENYLQDIISATRDNLCKLVEQIHIDFAAEITIDVPVTKIVPDVSGNVSFSVKISNAENRSEAEEIYLSVSNYEGKQIFHKYLSEKILTGGDSISELITIPAESNDAFDVTIVVLYDRGVVEKSVQLTVDSGKFEEIRNPYIAGNPVEKDEVFLGRNDLIKNLVNSLIDDNTRCVVIYGQKRSGKSSIFKHLKHKLEDKFIVLDFTAGSDITNEQNFYRCVRDELSAYMEDNDFDSETIEKFEDFDVSDYLGFEKFLRKAKREICKPADKELLLMIDEFTQIYNYIREEHAFTENFMDKWKALSEKNLFKSALIGQDNMPEFIRAYPNQFQVAEPVRVSYLEKEYAVELITKPIRFNDGKSRFLEGAEEKIADWFNGQPYYIQCYCRRLVEYLNLKKENYITTAVAEKIKKDLLDEANTMQLFDNLVEKDDFNSWNVLKKIAGSDVEDVPLDLASLSDSEKAALNKLTVRDVVNTKQGRYQIKIPFFREWIREYK